MIRNALFLLRSNILDKFIPYMNTVQSTTSLDQFAWEEWDKKLFFVLYRL